MKQHRLFFPALYFHFQIQLQGDTETVETGEQRGSLDVHHPQPFQKFYSDIRFHFKFSDDRPARHLAADHHPHQH